LLLKESAAIHRPVVDYLFSNKSRNNSTGNKLTAAIRNAIESAMKAFILETSR
jgi:hypothetical protein